MMHGKLYIPKTITIGFQNRTDTFTGKLGYVIYTDHAGKLRKEASWQSWRDQKIKPVTFDNTPQNGFTFNKGVKRDGYWGSGRSVIRVWDPRDFEFEISVDNLIGILMHADVSKRDITEPCVFAWNGTELVLLPTNSIEYQESTKHTEKQGQKFSAKDLVAGYTYSIKKDDTKVVYLGRFDRYDVKPVYAGDEETRRRYGVAQGAQHVKKPSKGHAFINPETKEVLIKDPIAFIAGVVSEEIHPNYAKLMDAYYTSAESQPVTGLTVSLAVDRTYWYRMWKEIGDNQFVELAWNDGYSDVKSSIFVTRFAMFDPATNTCEYSHDGRDSSWYHQQRITARSLPGMSKTRPDVVEMIAAIDAQYKAEMAKVPKDYSKQYEVRQRVQQQLAKEHKFGELRFVLANGKTSKDHSL